MYQDAEELIPGTIIVNSINEAGTLKIFGHFPDGIAYWVVDWTGRGLEIVPVEKIQDCVIL